MEFSLEMDGVLGISLDGVLDAQHKNLVRRQSCRPGAIPDFRI